MREAPLIKQLASRVADNMPSMYSTPQSTVESASYDCFISYCWRNSKAQYPDKDTGFADPREIAKKLEDHNLNVWLDVKVLGHLGLYEDIAKGLNSTKIVVACVSEEYAKSANCAMELRHATKNLRKPVIVCVVGASGSLKWAQTEIGLLVTDCLSTIVMSNKDDYELNFPRLLDEIKKKLQEINQPPSLVPIDVPAPVVESVVPPHSTTRLLGKTKSSSKLTQAEIESVSVDVERIIGNIQDKIEGLQRGFLSQIYSIDDSALFPRVFSLWCNNQQQPIGTQIWFLCEHPDQKLDIDASYLLLENDIVSSYVYPLAQGCCVHPPLTLAQILQQSSICDSTSYLQSIKTCSTDHNNLVEAQQRLQSFFHKNLATATTAEEVEKIVAPLRRVVLPTGEVHWLCSAHYGHL